MKTLDEVIEAVAEDLECANVSYPESFYDYDTHKDALHYLKEYKIKRERIMAHAQACDDAEKRLQDEIARYQEAVKNCEQAENKYRKAEQDALKALDDWASRPVEENKKLVLTVDNPPLTWDELKQMEGKPVWVEIWEATDSDFVQYRWGNGAWYIVKDFVLGALAEYCHLTPNRRTWIKQSYGEEWQAYRKERP